MRTSYDSLKDRNPLLPVKNPREKMAYMLGLKTSMAMAALVFATSALATGGGEIVKSDPTKHFDPKGKLPSVYSVEAQKQQRAMLPFEDNRDFEEAKKGFIAEPDYKQIMAEAGHVA